MIEDVEDEENEENEEKDEQAELEKAEDETFDIDRDASNDICSHCIVLVECRTCWCHTHGCSRDNCRECERES